jgi:hypothetical protein
MEFASGSEGEDAQQLRRWRPDSEILPRSASRSDVLRFGAITDGNGVITVLEL